MALINCPECGKQISDTVSQCIHCGVQFIVCPECKKPLIAGTATCPDCGFPIKAPATVEEAIAEHTEKVIAEHSEEATAEHSEEATAEHTEEATAEHTEEVIAEHTEEATAEHAEEATAEHTEKVTAKQPAKKEKEPKLDLYAAVERMKSNNVPYKICNGLSITYLLLWIFGSAAIVLLPGILSAISSSFESTYWLNSALQTLLVAYVIGTPLNLVLKLWNWIHLFLMVKNATYDYGATYDRLLQTGAMTAPMIEINTFAVIKHVRGGIFFYVGEKFSRLMYGIFSLITGALLFYGIGALRLFTLDFYPSDMVILGPALITFFLMCVSLIVASILTKVQKSQLKKTFEKLTYA